MRKIKENLLSLRSFCLFAFLSVFGMANYSQIQSDVNKAIQTVEFLFSGVNTQTIVSYVKSKFFSSSLDERRPGDEIHLIQSSRERQDAALRKGEDELSVVSSKKSRGDLNVLKDQKEELKPFVLDLYFHPLKSVKKNYLDHGIRSALSHRPYQLFQTPALKVEYMAWASLDKAQDVIKTECQSDEKCKKKVSAISLQELKHFPFPSRELAGLRAIFNEKTKKFSCPELKNPKLVHLNPLTQLTIWEQAFPQDKLKDNIQTLWLPQQELELNPHLKNNLYTWHEVGLDNSQSIHFFNHAKTPQDVICLPASPQVILNGIVGESCTLDGDCLSGCCQNGICGAHNPDKNLFCEKEEKQNCISSEYCSYIPDAQLWGGIYRNQKCQIVNSFKGREHKVCINGKCAKDTGWIANIKFHRELKSNECLGTNLPAPDEILRYKLDKDRNIILKDQFPLMETVTFQ